MTLLDPLFGWKPIDEIFSDASRLLRMLDFEAALARAEARVSLIPADAALSISSHCRAELFDLNALARAAADAGNLAIPMVRQLTDLVAKADKDAARYVHWGATSQDAIDTGLTLQLRDALHVVASELDHLCAALAQLAEKHRATPLAGAAGTLASLHDRGLDVAKVLAEELKLPLPDVPWHAHRDRIAEVATTLALLTGTLGKVARDLSLQMQTEVGELSEPAAAGRGGSSTMPQKRNPVACATILAAADRVPALASTILRSMTQEHERGLGNWHAEWETLPELVRLAAGALHRAAETLAGLEVDTVRMRQNLEITHGLIYAEAVSMALSPHLGKRPAHQILEKASQRAIAEKKHLCDILAADPTITSRISAAELDQLFDPANYTGMSSQFIDRVLATHKKSESKP